MHRLFEQSTRLTSYYHGVDVVEIEISDKILLENYYVKSVSVCFHEISVRRMSQFFTLRANIGLSTFNFTGKNLHFCRQQKRCWNLNYLRQLYGQSKWAFYWRFRIATFLLDEHEWKVASNSHDLHMAPKDLDVPSPNLSKMRTFLEFPRHWKKKLHKEKICNYFWNNNWSKKEKNF